MSAPLPVTLAADDQGMTMMSETVQGGASQQVITENLGPFFKSAVIGDNQRAGFVAVGNEVVQILGGLWRQGLQKATII